ncbi:phage baseplate assembly protein V [Accumulibacter sp.]|uniref:phage baseplate assembly protein V n=1 Tax=Accumulibacter sp. TaxID=2053492 RepID=UPI0025EFD245|nr:phage baseplate assembly protein V [Accumulibacter sp.]MCM8593857.1 phage baseplate assembly protein V [Accumulibacter sp.]MCM8626101.1 phage baseplate assembly protein V [Accumulibacter sp.]MDS4047998.1 phage baseplate assembly protein V [Accumulibacter sp.]
MFDSTPNEALYADRQPSGWGGRWYGCYPAQVTDLVDPDGAGRIRITLPWSPDGGGARYEAWARLATLFAGNDRGSWFVPEVDDEVLVVFEGGDARRPFIVGALWNGRDRPPVSADRRNVKKVIRSRNGVVITIEDQDGQEKLRLETPGGCSVTLEDGPGAIELQDSNGNSVKLESAGITVTAAAKVSVSASQVEVSAGMVSVSAGMSRFSGVVQADTVITNTIIAATYTPGAGNIL